MTSQTKQAETAAAAPEAPHKSPVIQQYLAELAALDMKFVGKSKLLDRYMNEAGDIRLEMLEPDWNERT